ncbi:MAG: UvrD-helicase domain-containing protein, partial [Thermodesulfobacteriota bacterium]
MIEQDIKTRLDTEQLLAVTHGDGPLLIIAGAGTGKTLVITHRIAQLIENGVSPSQILALTFTEKAASEMQERVDRLVPYGYADIWISTFHSFGDRLLRDYALELGLTPDFKVLSEAERIIFLKEHLFELPLNYYRPLGNPARHLGALLNLISRAKDEDVTPEEYLEYAEEVLKESGKNHDDMALKDLASQQMELAGTYIKYQELMYKEGYLDFGDQITLPLKLFRTRPAILKKYQNRFRFILVDEFQDTNYAQFQLVKTLSEGHGNINVVADDDQSIYKFRGAAISNVLNFQEVYPGARLVTLARSYRSVQPVLDAAYRLITHNNPDRLEVKSGIDKRLKAANNKLSEGVVKHLKFDTLSKEAETVADMIAERVKNGGYAYKDFAILVRANSDASPFLTAMNYKGVPYRFSGNKGLYSKEEIKDLIAFLRVITDFNDSISLFHLASSEVYGIKAEDLIPCHNLSHREHKPLYYVLKQVVEKKGKVTNDLSPDGLAAIEKLVGDIKLYSEMALKEKAGRVLYSFITDTGYLKGLSQEDTIEAVGKVQNIARFFEIIARFDDMAPFDKANQFVGYLNLLMEAGDNPASTEAEIDADAVNVLTVHKAKGLEFPVVFMVELVSQRFPRRSRKELIELPDTLAKDILPTGDFHLKEERRLFYVGMTRAMRELYLTSALDYGGVRQKKVSRFILEAMDTPGTFTAPVKSSPMEVIHRNAPAEKISGSKVPIAPDAGGLLKLSSYQIDDYRTCPLKYKYIHILNVPVLPHHNIIYGKAIHDAISAFFNKRLEGENLSVERLIMAFEASWKGEGFVTREHELNRLEAGKEVLRLFYHSQKEEGIMPSAVEKSFVFETGDNIIK